MPGTPAIGFIGFGEAGSNIAQGLRSAGVERLRAFDINTDTLGLGSTIQERARSSQTMLLRSSGELVSSSEWSADAGLGARFGPDGPATYREVLDALAGK